MKRTAASSDATPRMAKAVPFLGYIVLAATKPQ
jgi:hypothetical protein